MTSIVGALNTTQISKLQEQTTAISNSSTKTIKDGQFVFFAAFDGTNNNKGAVAPGETSTNVAKLFDQVIKGATDNPNVVAAYFPGPGTEGSATGSSWLSPKVTEEALKTASLAYAQFQQKAAAWLESNPDGDVSVAFTAFSRGFNAEAVFLQMVNELGVPNPNDPTGRPLVAPGQVETAGGIVFDPVSTGMNGNLTLPPNTENVTVIQAENEYRYLFKADDLSTQSGVRTLEFIGNHSDVGGSYQGNGLSASSLLAATKFFQKSNLSIADVDPENLPTLTNPIFIHNEGIDEYGNEIWSTYGQYGEYAGPRLTQAVADAINSTSSESDGTVSRTYKDYLGREIAETIASDNTSLSIKDAGKETITSSYTDGSYGKRIISANGDEESFVIYEDGGRADNWSKTDGSSGESYRDEFESSSSVTNADGSSFSSYSEAEESGSTAISVDGTITSIDRDIYGYYSLQIIYANSDMHTELRDADGSSSINNWYHDGTYDSHSIDADGSKTTTLKSADGSSSIDYTYADGSSGGEWKKADGSHGNYSIDENRSYKQEFDAEGVEYATFKYEPDPNAGPLHVLSIYKIIELDGSSVRRYELANGVKGVATIDVDHLETKVETYPDGEIGITLHDYDDNANTHTFDFTGIDRVYHEDVVGYSDGRISRHTLDRHQASNDGAMSIETIEEIDSSGHGVVHEIQITGINTSFEFTSYRDWTY
jgi:hypothetical protein